MAAKKSEARKIIDALKKGKYKVSYEAPNCFVEHTKIDGSTFYVIRGDDACFGCDDGSTTVSLLGRSFTWNPTESNWEGVDDVEVSDESETDDLVDTLNDLPVTRLDDCPDTDELTEFYELATGETLDEVYYYEDDDIPLDADDLVPISDFDEFGTATFDGETFVLCEEIQPPASPRDAHCYALAVAAKAQPDNTGSYPCVLLSFDPSACEESSPYTATSLEPSDSTFCPETGEVE